MKKETVMKKTFEDVRLPMEEAEKEVCELSDTELDQAVGGWITIIDTCQKQWNKNICDAFNPITGDRCCPHIDLAPAFQEVLGKSYRVYSCKKGYFKDELGL